MPVHSVPSHPSTPLGGGAPRAPEVSRRLTTTGPLPWPPRRPLRRLAPALLLALTPVLGGCGSGGDAGDGGPGEALPAGVGSGAAAPGAGAEGAASQTPGAQASTPSSRPPTGFTYAGPVLDLPPEPGEGSQPRHETERDWALAAGTVAWAREQGLSALPVPELVALLGPTFVGTPYEPGSLELPGEERLVVRLGAFDCVTFVEHVLVLAHLARDPATPLPAGPSDSDSPEARAFRDRYRALLTELRYRDARIDGYASRLHYFTEWLDHGIARGLFRDVTAELDGIPDPRPIHFMSRHPEAYRQLGEDPSLVDRIRSIEARLSQGERLYIPQERIAAVESGIRNGDIIAAVSTVDGLDIAHTGIALRHDGRIHLMHAPLVGDSVEISARPLAERIQGISGQKGIRVVRPLDAGQRP